MCGEMESVAGGAFASNGRPLELTQRSTLYVRSSSAETGSHVRSPSNTPHRPSKPRLVAPTESWVQPLLDGLRRVRCFRRCLDSSVCHQDLLVYAVSVFVFLILWFIVGICMVYTNKYILSKKGFRYPFTVCLVTNAIMWVFTYIVTRIPSLRQPSIEWSTYKQVVFPIGACTAMDIGVGNWALGYLNVSFFTMIRGTIPIFVLGIASLLGMEQPDRDTFGSVLLVCTGIMLASLGELHFHWFGFVLCIASCLIAGCRWVLIQKLVHGTLEGDTEDRVSMITKNTPLCTVLHVAPSTVLTAMPFAIALEIPHLLDSPFAQNSELAGDIAKLMLMITMWAFLLQLVKYKLVALTSSVSMAVAGKFKEILTIVGAIFFLGEQVNKVNLAGFALTLLGLGLYNCVKLKGLESDMGTSRTELQVATKGIGGEPAGPDQELGEAEGSPKSNSFSKRRQNNFGDLPDSPHYPEVT